MERLRELRLKAGFAQAAAAKQLGAERSTLAKWETGASNPSVDMLQKLAALYQCSIGELFGEECTAAPGRKQKNPDRHRIRPGYGEMEHERGSLIEA